MGILYWGMEWWVVRRWILSSDQVTTTLCWQVTTHPEEGSEECQFRILGSLLKRMENLDDAVSPSIRQDRFEPVITSIACSTLAIRFLKPNV